MSEAVLAMRTLLMSYCFRFLSMLHPLTASEKSEEKLHSFSFQSGGYGTPQNHPYLRDDNRQILLDVEGDKNYRTRVDRKVLKAFTKLVRQHPLAVWNNFKDQSCHAWLEERDRESFSLVIIWESGKN